MSKIWFWIMLLSFCFLIYFNPEALLAGMIDSSKNALTLAFSLIAIYAVWLGYLQILEDSGLSKKISKKLKPVTNKLFGTLNEQTNEYVCMNISANMLGVGGAATPLGIKAMQSMDDGSGIATYGMIMFFVLNATSLQILPTTVMGLRAAAGSANASSIILPSIITSIVSTIVGVTLVYFCNKLRGRKTKRKKVI